MVHVMSFQLAIFFKQHITRPDHFFSSINDAAGNLFDRMPQIIPLPDEVPPEWICPYISRHLLSLNPLLACCRRYSRGER